MKIYSHFGFNEFVILLGYKGYYIKEYFVNYFLHQSDVTIDLGNNKMEVHANNSEPWKVTLLETGLHSMTGGRILKAQHYLGSEQFMLTYGDVVANIDIRELLRFHKQHGKAITMTSIQPEGRFGALQSGRGNQVLTFTERPQGDGSRINGGFFVCEPKVFDYIEDEQTVFEHGPMEKMTSEGELFTYHHDGFWKCMDTLRDKSKLNELWDNGEAKWRTW